MKPIGDTETVFTYEASGRITAGPIYAKISNPSFSCSSMDGYALDFALSSGADVSRPLSLTKGTDVLRVNTGDPLPSWTNAVVMIEDVEETGSAITIRKPLHLWQNVRLTGEDVIEGDMLFPSQYEIRTIDIGTLISGGIAHVSVKRKPRLIVIPTGKELVDIFNATAPVTSPNLVEFNSYTLSGLSGEMGFIASRRPAIRDFDELCAVLDRESRSFDAILVIAGSSAGTEDFTESAVSRLGKVLFHGIAVMPGKPTLFGVINGTPIIGIPGYPVSAIVGFETIVRPLYERLTGTKKSFPEIPVRAPFHLPSKGGLEEQIRVNLIRRGRYHYAFPLPRGASIFSSMTKADGVVSIPAESEGTHEGEQLTCRLLRPLSEINNRINVIGSHDLSLDILRDMIRRRATENDLISIHVGSEGGVSAFGRQISTVATTHILDEEEKIYNIPYLLRHIPHRRWTLIHIAKRMQGLVVRKGNPLNVTSFDDLVRGDLRFINRQHGSGTRILLDMSLRERGIDPSAIRGYDREESTHIAVALMVKESIADTCLAIYAAAKIFSLEFIPVVEEDYDLLVAGEFTGSKKFTMLLELLRSDEFRSKLESFGGYNASQSGMIKYAHRPV